MTKTRLGIILGTRPEIIKLAPILRACQSRGVPFTLIHTGQHYSDELDSVFFERLELPEPDHHLGVGSDTHGAQTGAMMARIEEVLELENVNTVVVQGDTNSVLAGALVASKMDVELGHIEAGLRSFDRAMPEEINRVVTDHIGDYLFAPTNESAELLREEGLPDERIFVTGNTIVDAVQGNRELAAEKSSIVADLNLLASEFGLMTAHRAENVDDRDRLKDILTGVNTLGTKFDIPIVYPIHPRTRERLKEFSLSVPDRIQLTEPLDFLDFLRLEDKASIVVTDSGGVQEETCILQTPCVTVRDSTERPETVSVGANIITGTNPADIVEGASTMRDRPKNWTSPFGDGKAADRILDVLVND